MRMQYSDPLDARPRPALDSSKRKRAGSVMVMFTLMMPFVLVPMVGLAIDATMLFSVKAKLQAAVDGGAIAAAQSLNSGLTFTTQKATAEKTADEFIKANITVTGSGHSGYWGAYSLNDTNCNGSPCIVAAEDNTNKRRTVSVDRHGTSSSAVYADTRLFHRIGDRKGHGCPQGCCVSSGARPLEFHDAHSAGSERWSNVFCQPISGGARPGWSCRIWGKRTRRISAGDWLKDYYAPYGDWPRYRL